MSFGFENAPTTQVISILVMIFSVFVDKSLLVGAGFPAMLGFGELYRLFTSQFCFESSAETFVGLLLLYIMRKFERDLGPRKFGAFIVLTLILSTVLQVSLSVITSSIDLVGMKSQANGPYTLLFALLALYHKYVPKIQPSRFSILGLELSEKTGTYVLASHLFLNRFAESIIPSVSGLLIGYLYVNDHLGLQSFRLPTMIEKVFSLLAKIFSFMLPSSVNSETSGSMASTGTSANGIPPSGGTNGTAMEGEDDTGFDRARIPSWSEATAERISTYGGLGDAIEPPSEQVIEMLTNMGFTRARAIHALEQTNNDATAATNYLLGER
jgi:membrane associated rhomboid family serine protease